MRAAGPPRAAVRGRHRRPAAAAGDRARPRDDVHDHGGGLREGRRRRRPRRRGAALARDGRAGRLRLALLAPRLPTGSRRRCRGSRASARARAATASGRASPSAPRSASSTRRARARSSPRSSRSAPPPARSVAVALAYCAGSAVVLLALALGGRRVLDRSCRGPRPGAPARARRRDAGDRAGGGHRHRRALPDRARRPLPGRARQPHRLAGALRRGRAAARRPARRGALRAPPRTPPRRARSCRCSAARRTSRATSAGSTARPLTLAALRGRVVLIDFWTYTCINCIRTLPYLSAWDARYRDRGLTIVGVHSPEFSFENDAGNVARRDHAERAALPGRPGQRVRRPGTRGATSTGPPST